MLEQLKEAILTANLSLPKHGLVIFAWKNVSSIDRESRLVFIKPSRVSHEQMYVEVMVIVDLNGKVIEGKTRPSSDTPIHIQLYMAFPQLGIVAHTHSIYATSRAHTGRSNLCYGTTQADYFYGSIPCAGSLIRQEIDSAYEQNNEKVIIEAYEDSNILSILSVLCANHGFFAFEKDADTAIYNAVVLEEVAKMALFPEQLKQDIKLTQQILLNKHYVSMERTLAMGNLTLGKVFRQRGNYDESWYMTTSCLFLIVSMLLIDNYLGML